MTTALDGESALRRQYVKLCDRRDFDDLDVQALIHDIVPGLSAEETLNRKYWEYALLALFLKDVELLEENMQVLSVGAGHEEVLFWLPRYVGRLVATDVYGEGAFASSAGDAADATMLTDPSAFAPYPYNKDRLEVRKMDARSLEFDEGSFDAVFTLSSIEHFGGPRDIEQSAKEIGRVLRPGGYAFIVTECFVGRHPLNSPLLQTGIRIATLGRRCAVATPRRRMLDVFTPAELKQRIIRPSGLRLLQPLRSDLSPETWDNVTYWVGEGELRPATGRKWPHILLKAHGSPWTSVALALQKPT
jgi:SAM-dependent methyltransferase